MRVISRRPLARFGTIYRDAKEPLERWRQCVQGAEWSDFGAVRRTFPAADVFEKCVIFNIGGNKYRLIAAIHYRKTTNEGKIVDGRVYVRSVLTHAEYDKGLWKDDCMC